MHFLWFAKRFGVVWWAVAKSKQNKACLIVLQIAAPGPPLPKHITPHKMKTSHQASYKVKHLKNLEKDGQGAKLFPVSASC